MYTLYIPSKTSNKEGIRKREIMSFQFGKLWNLPFKQGQTLNGDCFVGINFSSKHTLVLNQVAIRGQHSLGDGQSPFQIQCIKAPPFCWDISSSIFQIMYYIIHIYQACNKFLILATSEAEIVVWDLIFDEDAAVGLNPPSLRQSIGVSHTQIHRNMVSFFIHLTSIRIDCEVPVQIQNDRP